MDTPSWFDDTHSLPNGDDNMYQSTGDSSLPYMTGAGLRSFDSGAAQYQQIHHQMSHSTPIANSPSPHNGVYQTQPVIPSKRPRPRENSVGASPIQYPGAIPDPRAQTPHNAYTSYQPVANGGQPYPSNPSFQQMHQAHNHSVQSPMLQNQLFNSQSSNQNAQAMSPSSFSTAAQNFGGQHSPPHSDHGTRVSTPQNGGPSLPQGINYSIGTSQNPAQPVGVAINGNPPSSFNPQPINFQQQQRTIYEAQVRRMQQSGNMGIPQRAISLNQIPNQLQYHQSAPTRSQQASQSQHLRPNSAVEPLAREMLKHAASRGQQFNAQPMILGKQILCATIFMAGMKLGGSRILTAHGGWPQVAQYLGFPPQLTVAAGQEIQNYWNHFLLLWESHWTQQQVQRQRAIQEGMKASGDVHNGDNSIRQESFSPSHPLHDNRGQKSVRHSTQVANPTLVGGSSSSSLQHDFRETEQITHLGQQQLQPHPHTQRDRADPYGHTAPQDSPPTALASIKPKSEDAATRTDKSSFSPRLIVANLPYHPCVAEMHSVQDIQPVGVSLQEKSRRRNLNSINDPYFQATLTDLSKYKQSTPHLQELGIIDLQALTLSLKSGIDGEVRHAIDVIVSLSLEQPIVLNDCDDLLDTLVYLAYDQIDIIDDAANRTSESLAIEPYESVARKCFTETKILQAVPKYRSARHRLNRAAEILKCIIAIMRNFTFFEQSCYRVKDSNVVRMMISVIQHIGTRALFLQTNQNTLEFSKDAIVYMSASSAMIDLTSKDEALSLLHFLLSFAPPTLPLASSNEITSSTHDSATHAYLPYAINSLANLLARDPNRSLLRTIYTPEFSSSQSLNLFIRTLGLVIAAIPKDVEKDSLLQCASSRASIIIQALLSAEILIDMMPLSENRSTYSWLTSHNGLSSRLVGILSVLGVADETQYHWQGSTDGDGLNQDGIRTIFVRALAVLRRLGNRADDADASKICRMQIPQKRYNIVRSLASQTEGTGMVPTHHT